MWVYEKPQEGLEERGLRAFTGCTGDSLKVTGSSFGTESDTNGCSLKLSEA